MRTMAEARGVRAGLLKLCDRLGLPLEFRSPEGAFREESRNWHKASEKTRHYLSW